MTKVVVTGIGAVAANGLSAEEIFSACLQKKSGLKKCSLFSAPALRTEYVGEIPDPTLPKHRRTLSIAEKAADQAILDAGVSPDYFEKCGLRAALCFATLLSPTENMTEYLVSGDKDALCRVPEIISSLRKKYKLFGPSFTDSAACAAGTTTLGIAFDLIREGKADVVLAGGADPLSKFACFGFHSLQSLSSGTCRPFDKERDGINLGEGGAFFVVESEEHALKRKASIRGEIVGYGLNNDAYHITSPDPEGYGAVASVTEAAKTVPFSEIGYVNAHGTGTILNDAMEASALRKSAFSPDLIVSSSKSFVGHCLAAAGAVEGAITLLALQKGIFPPNLDLDSPMEECSSYVYPASPVEKNAEYALSDSFAFGGNTASILFKKYNAPKEEL